MIVQAQNEAKQRKKPGPVPTGIGKPVMVRCKESFLKEIDDWRSRQRPIPTRSEAIRQLAALGLKRGK
jgi:hypothetical protein